MQRPKTSDDEKKKQGKDDDGSKKNGKADQTSKCKPEDDKKASRMKKRSVNFEICGNPVDAKSADDVCSEYRSKRGNRKLSIKEKDKELKKQAKEEPKFTDSKKKQSGKDCGGKKKCAKEELADGQGECEVCGCECLNGELVSEELQESIEGDWSWLISAGMGALSGPWYPKTGP